MDMLQILCLLVVSFLTFVWSLDVTYIIPEEQRIGSEVGNVANDSNLDDILGESERNNIRYTILESTYSSHFRVSESDSTLYINKTLDRETLSECEFSSSCQLQIDIVAQAIIGTFFRKIKVKITLTDINDHKPQFPQNTMTIELSESFDIGMSAPLVGAVDLDTGENSVKSYKLLPDETTFKLQYEQYVDGSSSVRLVGSAKLDRETVDGYQLQVIAIDGGNPTLSGTLHLNVIVTDVNDNAPSFEQNTYSVSVNEALPIGSVIYTVKAIDPDLDKNGQVTYNLSPHQSDATKELFSVNNKTGDIYVMKTLVYTSDKPYEVIIEAKDGAVIPLISQTTIFVTILDSGNDAPIININLLSNTDVAKISENASVGAAVAHIAVSDDDTDKNGEVTCTITHNTFTLETIAGESKEYKVVVKVQLDREKEDHYTVIVDCYDGGSPPKSSSAGFDVKVLDENDNRPTFLKHQYDVVMLENDHTGALITKVSAIDTDIGNNADITYSVESSSQNFRVDPSGNVYANFVLDRETIPYMELRIIARDKGLSPLTGTAVVTLNLTDINDNPPRFNKSVYVMHVKENQDIGHYVGEVIAEDPDLGRNSIIKFVADPKIDDIEVLSDGSIFTSKRLDREARPHGYNFNIIAFDNGLLPLNSTAHVTVFVVDENDNDPVIRFPAQDNSTIQIVYEKPTNSIITYVIADDSDTGNNAILTYSILQTEMLNTFRINRNTGEITLARQLSSADMRTYTLTVEVADGGTPPRKDRQNLTIVISSNAPILLPRTEPEKDNTLIVVAIVCVTVILSGAIIMGIFLIRRMDKKKKNKKRNAAACMNDEKDMYDSIHKNGSLPHSDYEHGEKKVCFSNGVAERSRQHITGESSREQISRIGDPIKSQQPPRSSLVPGNRKNQSNLSIQNIQMTKLQLHQSNLHSLPAHNLQPFHRKHEDNHSETSGETNDSGRGGSESDIHSNGLNHSVELDHIKNRYSPINSPGRPLLTKKHTDMYPHPKERHRQNPQLLVQNNNKRHFPQISEGPPYRTNMAWSSISDVLNGSMGTIDDYDDDTTTSGSYVVDEQELDLDYIPRDCVV